MLSFSFVLMVDKILFSHNSESDGKEIAETVRKSMIGGKSGADQFLNPENPDYMEDNWKSLVGKKSQLALRASFYGKQGGKPKAGHDSFAERSKKARSILTNGDEENHRTNTNRHITAEPGGYGLQDPFISEDATTTKVGIQNSDNVKASTKENNVPTPDHSERANARIQMGDYKDVIDEVEDNEITEPKKCNVGPYVLALAMGIHAAFAGLALGLSRDMQGFIGLLAAILAHKWAEALTVGINFAKCIDDIGMKQAILLMVIFSFATPVGMAVGMA